MENLFNYRNSLLMMAVREDNIDFARNLLRPGFVQLVMTTIQRHEFEDWAQYRIKNDLEIILENDPTFLAQLAMKHPVEWLDLKSQSDIASRAESAAMLRTLLDGGFSSTCLTYWERPILIRDQMAQPSSDPPISREEYLHSSRLFLGNSNPQDITDRFKLDMIWSGCDAYSARDYWDDPPSYSPRDPAWCNSRFGQTTTCLSDGRMVLIGGEHDDWYDSEFKIYNDVIVIDPEGNTRVYGYPEDVFPPTDFHAAVAFENGIYIIGSLGYTRHRLSTWCPVFRLDLASYAIEEVKTYGDDPGRIHRFTIQEVSPGIFEIWGGQVIQRMIPYKLNDWTVVPMEVKFQLDLHSKTWTRLS